MSPENKTYPLLKNLQTVCLKQNIPFASYRLPLQQEIITMIQHRSFPTEIDLLNHTKLKSGFVIAPFIESDSHRSYILEPDNIIISDNVESSFIQKLSQNNEYISVDKPSVKDKITTSSEDFINQVNDAKKAITEGQFHKVVLSKIRVEQLKTDFDARTFFFHLCEVYPYAFVYLIQLPEVGCWIGASPEPLMVIEEGKVKTVSLAGTQIATESNIDSYHWNKKEIEEQGIVTGFVEKTLRSLHIDNYSIEGPSNYKAANLIHLKTTFEFKEADLRWRIGDLLKALHPTPSVGGLPKDTARDFILKNEKHDRFYYTGFLGPLNIENKSHLFVNLRCLQLFKNQFVLYSGAGITASSIAENEWEETDNKMLTMMNALKSL